MILSDFLSRQIEDDSDLHEILPISFNVREILQENYLNITKDAYMVQTRSQAKAQTNAPTIPSTKPVMQKTIQRLLEYPSRQKKIKILKHHPAE